MLSNFDSTNGQACRSLISGAWQWLTVGLLRALRQARVCPNAADTASAKLSKKAAAKRLFSFLKCLRA